MGIFLLVVAWLLAGCAIAWLMGAAASMGEPALIEPNPDQDALNRTGSSSTIEPAPGPNPTAKSSIPTSA
jgi:hypothetical protein